MLIQIENKPNSKIPAGTDFISESAYQIFHSKGAPARFGIDEDIWRDKRTEFNYIER